MTVERAKVDVYAEIAKILWTNLLGGPEDELANRSGRDIQAELLAQFMRVYVYLESSSAELYQQLVPADVRERRAASQRNAVRLPEGLVESEIRRLEDLRRLRNELVHGRSSQAEAELTPELIAEVRRLADTLWNAPTLSARGVSRVAPARRMARTMVAD